MDAKDIDNQDLAYDEKTEHGIVAGVSPVLNYKDTELRAKARVHLTRKIDWHIMPLMFIVYGLSAIDKLAISYASLMGLFTSTHITVAQYSNVSSAFWIGYVIAELPAARLLQRFPLAKVAGAMICCWAAVLCLTTLCDNYGGLFAARFFLGICESGIAPAMALLVSRFYQPEQQGSRTAWWFASTGIANVAGAGIAYGFAKANIAGNLAITGWKALFVLLGLITFVIGLAFLFLVPSTPSEARWLSDADKATLDELRRAKAIGISNRAFKWSQVKETVLDVRVWLYFLFSLLTSIPNGSVVSFFGTIIGGLGYTQVQAILYTAPVGAVQFVTTILGLWIGDRLRMRLGVSAFLMGVALAGMGILYGLPATHPWARLAGFWIYACSTCAFVCVVSLVSSNVAGGTKHPIVAASYFIAFAIGNLIGPQTFRAADAPHYAPAFITIIVCQAVSFCILLLIWLLNVMENRRRDRICSAPGYKPADADADLTDRQNMEFRYKY